MPVTPNLLERLVLLRCNRGPGPLLDLLGAAGSRAVDLALEMGVFETLADGPLSPEELAGRIDADDEGTAVLLAFLGALGYVTESGGRYANAAMTEKWLLDDSPTSVADWLTFWRETVFDYWDDTLETAVREGEPPRTLYEWLDDHPGRWPGAQAGFAAAAAPVIEDVVAAVEVPAGPARLLDVGGGHGRYSVALCEHNPDLRATVFDRAAALEAAREAAAAAGLADRIDTRAGDYHADDLGEGYDLALVFNVLHGHDATENVALLERVRDALAPGGRVVVLDQFRDTARTPVGRLSLAFVDLTYLTTLGRRAPEYEGAKAWLRAAGFEDVELRGVGRIPGIGLLSATRA